MKIGLLLPTRDALLDGDPSVEPILRLAQDAEAAGLDSVWVGDSPVARPRHDTMTVLAAVAARTRRITLGSAVLVAPLRHPLLVLHQAATVDLISDGRLVLGLGAGFPLAQTQQQFESLQADYARRGARLDDVLRLASHLWSGPGGPFTGKTMSADDPKIEPGPRTPGGPPRWIAAGGPRGLRRVGELADGWLPYPPTPETYAADLAAVRRAADDAGRACPVPAFYATVCVGDDAAAAKAALDAGVERYYGYPAAAVQKHQAVFGGTPDELVPWLQSYQQAGAEHVVVRFSGQRTQPMIQLLAQAKQTLSTPASRPAHEHAGAAR